MATVDFAELLGPALGTAISEKGFTELTPVKKAVLDPAVAGRDLRITSQTGSGKTLAIGFVVRELAAAPSSAKDKVAHPRALVIVPTRELAKQVVQELTWLFAPINVKVASVTGGAVYRDEHRSLAAGPSVVVGTPGRMLDHLNRGSIVPNEVGAVVLDEADRMLDLGFREELEAILGMTPKDRQTHLVSATFPRDVEALANSVQKNPARVEGTRLGVANLDIDHVMHVLEPRQRLDAVINLLLASPDAQTLIFARTRADVGDVAERLSEAGFAVNALSGEMDQRERDRALNSFRRADQRVLVATDVAARGIDVQDITLVIHLDPPTDPDSYTHRSGRTGRAGRKGRSVLLVSPSAVGKTTMLLKRAKVVARTEQVPSAEQIRATGDQKFFDALTGEDGPATEVSARHKVLAERLAAREDVALVLSRLLAMARAAGPTEPREIRRIDRGPERKGPHEREQRGPAARGPNRDRGDRGDRGERPTRERAEASHAPTPYRGAQRDGGDWVSFRVTWGGDHGADARKLLAMVCRWGEIRGSDVGAIEIERDYSRISVKAGVAGGFADATAKPDARNPRVTIQPDSSRKGFAPHTSPPPPPRHAPSAPRHVAPPRDAHGPEDSEGVPPQPERALPRNYPAPPKHIERPRDMGPPHAAGSARDAGVAPRSGGFPRDASRPRVVSGYPRDAKKNRPTSARDARPNGPRDTRPNGPREGARPHAGPREGSRPHAAPRPIGRPTDATPPRDGGQPPRRRRVVTR
jgi:ATP-dependent RNA helicase DeaD